MASAMEAEIAAMFMNARLLIEYRQALEDMGHQQPPTVIRTDSETGCGVINGTMRQRRSKVVDMNLNWIKDRCERKQFDIKWAPGATNRADYTTKHHTGTHHRLVRPIQLYMEGKSPTTLQGCDRITGAKDKTVGSIPTISMMRQ